MPPACDRLLLVNGNASPQVTERLAEQARCWFPQVEIQAVTPSFGPRYVSSPADYAVAGHAVAEAFGAALKAYGPRHFSAGVVACFGEPGIAAARSLGAFPVVGLAEAAVLSAMQLGERYAIVTIGAHWPAMLRRLLRECTLIDRCADIVSVEAEALSAFENRSTIVAQVAKELRGIAVRRSADVIILGGAALAGLANELQSASTLPLVCSLKAGIAQGLAVARLSQADLSTSTKGLEKLRSY